MLENTPMRDWVNGSPAATVAIAGRWLQDPNTGLDREPMVQSTPENIEAALACAHALHQHRTWANTPAMERARLLHQIGVQLENRTEALARTAAQQTGVVITQTDRFARLIPIIFKNAARLLEEEVRTGFPGPHGEVEVHRLPLGPALCIGPWNAPTAIASHKVASALAAGCPAILKPSEWAPATANIVADVIGDSDLPKGVFQLVHGAGDVGATLTADPRIRAVSFTGGLAGGRAVAVACAEQMKPAQLELGGNNPLVVLQDADLELAAEGVVTALTRLNGQWCRALGRIFAHRSVAESLLNRVGKKLAALRVGHSLDAASEMGPLIHQGHYQAVASSVEKLRKCGGEAHQWTPVPPGEGFFHPPTLVTGCSPEDTMDEVFGPVAAVHTFEDEEEMFSLVHQAPYGLAAYLFGEEQRAMGWARQFEVGSTKINGVTVTSLNPEAPRSAWKLSGLGVEGHRETFEFFQGIGVVGVAGRTS